MKRAVILIVVLVLVAAVVAAVVLFRKDPPVNVVLVVFDTCRADHLGCYGHTTASTPTVDRLAAEGLLFERAYAQVPLTLPGHTTLFTGTYPEFHRIRDNASYTIPDEQVTLAEILGQNGYTTAAFIGAFPLDGRFNLDQGFDTYDGHFPRDSERPAGLLNRAVEEWIGVQSGTGPYFIFLHYFDPHLRYLPPPPFSERFEDAPYDGEIAYADFCLGEITEKLETICPRERTLWIFTSDHGESLWDHGERYHGIFLYDSTLRVPMIWSFPERIAPNQRTPAVVQLVDVMPTLLEFLGIDAPACVQGSSLMPLLRDASESVGPGRSHAETYFARLRYGWSGLRSLRTDRWLYVAAPREELYDLNADPGQTQNVIDEHADAANALRKRLAADLQQFSAPPEEPRPVSQIDPETEARLLSLGYLGRVSNTINDPGLEDSLFTGPDPKDRIGTMVHVESGRRHMDEQDWSRAEEELRRALAIAPNLVETRDLLARALQRQERFLEASEVWRGLAGDYPDDPLYHMWLAQSLEKAGRESEALEAYRRSIPLVPDPSAVQTELTLALARMGRMSEYATERRRLLEMDPLPPQLLNHLSLSLIEAGFPREGISLFEECIVRFPEDPDAYNALAWELIDSGEDVARGVELAERAVVLDPTERAFLDTRGWGYLKLGRAEEAVVELRRAAEGTFVPDIAHHLALACLEAGKPEEARDQLHRIIDESPDYPRIDEVRVLLSRL